jgi:hypothetical protein
MHLAQSSGTCIVHLVPSVETLRPFCRAARKDLVVLPDATLDSVAEKGVCSECVAKAAARHPLASLRQPLLLLRRDQPMLHILTKRDALACELQFTPADAAEELPQLSILSLHEACPNCVELEQRGPEVGQYARSLGVSLLRALEIIRRQEAARA